MGGEEGQDTRRTPARAKGKVHKVAVRPAMLYELETVALTKRRRRSWR